MIEILSYLFVSLFGIASEYEDFSSQQVAEIHSESARQLHFQGTWQNSTFSVYKVKVKKKWDKIQIVPYYKYTGEASPYKCGTKNDICIDVPLKGRVREITFGKRKKILWADGKVVERNVEKGKVEVLQGYITDGPGYDGDYSFYPSERVYMAGQDGKKEAIIIYIPYGVIAKMQPSASMRRAIEKRKVTISGKAGFAAGNDDSGYIPAGAPAFTEVISIR